MPGLPLTLSTPPLRFINSPTIGQYPTSDCGRIRRGENPFERLMISSAVSTADHNATSASLPTIALEKIPVPAASVDDPITNVARLVIALAVVLTVPPDASRNAWRDVEEVNKPNSEYQVVAVRLAPAATAVLPPLEIDAFASALDPFFRSPIFALLTPEFAQLQGPCTPVISLTQTRHTIVLG